MLKDYKILESDNINRLSVKILELSKEHYELYGNPYSYTESETEYNDLGEAVIVNTWEMHCQAMILTDQSAP